VRSSATDQDTAAGYQIETLTNDEVQSDYHVPGTEITVRKGDDGGDLSYLKFQVPMDFASSAEGLSHYQRFLHFVCQHLPVRGGSGGLSAVLPYRPRYLPQEWALAARFSGLDIDSHGFMQEKNYKMCSCIHGDSDPEKWKDYFSYLKPGANVLRWGFIKCVNWYTLLGDIFVDRLGGEERIRRALARPDIGIERVGQCLSVRAGAFPRLGAPEEGLPEPYVFVNQVLRVLRNPDPESHHYNEGVPVETRAWEARFDLPGSAPIPVPPAIVPLPDDELAKEVYWPQ
jgi:hypothetical protein